MIRAAAELVDAWRVWHKVTFERGRILSTPEDARLRYEKPGRDIEPPLFPETNGQVPDLAITGEETRRGARVRRFAFPTLHPVGGGLWGRTNTATGSLYVPMDRPDAPLIVLSHGWAHQDARGIEAVFVTPLLRAGYAVALPTHAFHLDRTPEGTYSGELMVSGDAMLTVEAFRQSVADLCGLVNWLRAMPGGRARPIGLLGYSLGGYIAGLAACLRDDLDAVVVAGAGDSVVSPILDTHLGVNVREDLSRTGMHRRDRLERAWGPISPGRFPLRVPADRVLLVAGLYDRIMLRSSVRRLWEAWGRPGIRWEPQAHYTLLAVPGRVVRYSLPVLRRWMPTDRP